MTPQTAAKRLVLTTAKRMGLFRVARRLTKSSLRILCYHGFSLSDEDQFRPGTFMRRETFRQRLEYLRTTRTPVLPLVEALERLDRGTLPNAAAVITIDDGFYSTHRIAREELVRYGFPATVYLTTYHVVKGTPIFRLVVQYMFWKTTRSEVDLSGLGLDLPQATALREFSDELIWSIIGQGECRMSEAERVELLRHLGSALGIDYDAIAASRMFSLMSADEIHEMQASGIDFQLHTHRHNLPEAENAVVREINDNRAVLASLGVAEAVHFCYPSGIWSPRHAPGLQATGVRSATTCDPGLIGPRTSRLALPRFLDGEGTSQLNFEAALSGFKEFVRLPGNRRGNAKGFACNRFSNLAGAQ